MVSLIFTSRKRKMYRRYLFKQYSLFVIKIIQLDRWKENNLIVTEKNCSKATDSGIISGRLIGGNHGKTHYW